MSQRFELLRQLGTGRTGAVWLARDADTELFLAMKLLHVHRADDESSARRLLSGVDVAARVQSQRVAQVYGFGTLDGIPFLAMEYVPGQSLRENIRAHGPLSWAEAKPVLRQAAEGLAAAHAAGVVHGDLQTTNVLVTRGGAVKLTGFGASATRSWAMTGSSAELPPGPNVDPRSDLHALGLVLFEMLAVQPASEGVQGRLRARGGEPRHHVIPDGEGRRIAAWLLQNDPRKRPASATALIAALDGMTPIPGASLRRTPSSPRSPLVFAAPAAGLILLGALAIGYAGARSSNAQARAALEPAPTAAPATATPSRGAAGEASRVTETARSDSSPARSATPTPSRTQSPAATSTPVRTGGFGVASEPTTDVSAGATQAPPTAAPPPPGTPAQSSTPPASPTATPGPSYALEITFDRYQFAPGEEMEVCYELTPGTPFQFVFWESIDGAPREVLMSFNDDGNGGCIRTVIENEGFREYTFEARINGKVVATRIGHAQAGSGGTTFTSIQ